MADIVGAERKAQSLIRKYSLNRPPVDPESIARREGLEVFYVTFSGPVNDQTSGYIKENKITVNIDQPPQRKTYTIAHELGHFLLHSDYIKSADYQVFPRRDDPSTAKSPQQQEADAFAAELLVPLDVLRNYRRKASPEELASIFLVDPDLIRNRLTGLE